MKQKLSEILSNYYQKVQSINKDYKIEELNKKETLSQEDLHELVSGGTDKWSNMNAGQILNLWIEHDEKLANYLFREIQEAFGANLTLKSRAMRWVCRGLKVEHAIQKIKFDQIMYKN